MPLDFKEITDGESFELFCTSLFRLLQFEIISPPGRGIDAGVDLIVRTPIDPNLGFSNIFLVQCKHFAKSGRAVGLEDLHGLSPLDLLTRHSAHGYLLITSTVPSQSLQNHFKTLGEKTGKQLIIWGKDILEERVALARDANIVQQYFPNSGQLLRDSILLPPHIPRWDTITTMLHARAITDIAQNIGQKYIPDLYISRGAVETRVDSFTKASTSSGNLVNNFRRLKEVASELIKNTPEILKRAESSKIITAKLVTAKQIKEVEFYTEFGLELEGMRESYKQTLKKNPSVEPLLQYIDRHVSEIIELVDPLKNLHICTRTKIESLLALIQSKFFDLSNHINEIKEKTSNILNLTVKEKGEIREKGRQTPTLIKPLLNFLNIISGAAEELLSGINVLTSIIEEIRHGNDSLLSEMNPAIVLVERAGRGKTNLVCDLAKRIGLKQAVFFIAAKSLPLTSEDPIKKHIIDRLQTLSGFRHQDPIAVLSQVAHANDSGIVIIIDGINESVNPFEFANKIHGFLADTIYLPLRVIVTCREEYWSVFKNINYFVAELLHGDLDIFTERERDQAIKKYFEHYRIVTQIDSEPLKALRDPLLLRFFCEAYSGRSEFVGTRVNHIRLKPLFDEYKKVKYFQISTQVKEVRSSNAVSEYINRIARTLLDNHTTALNRESLEGVIPIDDLNNVGSLYSRLLDEDIVIEQRFQEESGAVVVNFTYEAFMEYVLGGIIDSELEHKNVPIKLFLSHWLTENERFPNAAGVLGFFLAFLFERNKEDFFETINWLHTTGQEEHLYALQIALDNLPPEEYDAHIFTILLKRIALAKDQSELKLIASNAVGGGNFIAKNALIIASKKSHYHFPDHHIRGGSNNTLITKSSNSTAKFKNAFGYDEAFRLILRCPSSLADSFSIAFNSDKFDTSFAPLIWADIFEHFGTQIPDLMWESIRLRFSTRQPLRKLRTGQIRKILHWCKQSPDLLSTNYGQKVARKLINQWEALHYQVRKGQYGGWNHRAKAVEELIRFLRETENQINS
jgi:hypothetical protein